jgi:hypothetical protein
LICIIFWLWDWKKILKIFFIFIELIFIVHNFVILLYSSLHPLVLYFFDELIVFNNFGCAKKKFKKSLQEYFLKLLLLWQLVRENDFFSFVNKIFVIENILFITVLVNLQRYSERIFLFRHFKKTIKVIILTTHNNLNKKIWYIVAITLITQNRYNVHTLLHNYVRFFD